ncbi:hypothetical protein ACLOJK_007809 [Asimina triloba]
MPTTDDAFYSPTSVAFVCTLDESSNFLPLFSLPLERSWTGRLLQTDGMRRCYKDDAVANPMGRGAYSEKTHVRG